MSHLTNDHRSLTQRIGFFTGPIAAALFWVAPAFGIVLDPANPALGKMAAVAILMAVWWMTEAIPLAMTALLPLAAYPLMAIPPYEAVAQEYASPVIFLFLGGFIIAIAIEESGLHRRVALAVLSVVGDQPQTIVLGFMLAAAGLSMWISNTATCLMMLPIAMSVITQADRAEIEVAIRRRFQAALLLGTAYGSSIGGIATYIGTPPNALFKEFYEKTAPGQGISFLGWMLLAGPLCGILLFAAWGLMVYAIFPLGDSKMLGGGAIIRRKFRELGRMTRSEFYAATIFLVTALLWITRAPLERWGWAPWLGIDSIQLDSGAKVVISGDSTVAILMAIVCFLVPSGRSDGLPLVTWRMTTRLPWGVLLLFGGGLALATGMQKTGLDLWIGRWLGGGLEALNPLGMIALVTGGMTFFTELTSNTACIAMMLPILDGSAKQLGMDPLNLMIPATLAASCAFMLPVATPPNAIVYGTGRIKIGAMVRAGFFLNLISIVVITVWLSIVVSWF
ncbi:MAG: SLC13/DASS family transporter [Pirellulales bacterium]|nr:SLC13/DASS family transporter [Pirellulales bacterium]